jgi:hypothetical protein
MSSQTMKNKKTYGLLSVLLVSNITMMSPSVSAQEKICVLTDAGKKICGTLIKPIAYNPVSPSKSFTLTYPSYPNEVVKVELQKCSRKSTNVTCKFSIVKTEGDKNPDTFDTYLFAANGTDISQATDGKGEDYTANQITMGANISSNAQQLVMIRNQLRSATLSFRIPPHVNYLQTLRIGTRFNGEVGIAQFSDVSISQ